jgi:hypothetical protein
MVQKMQMMYQIGRDPKICKNADIAKTWMMDPIGTDPKICRNADVAKNADESDITNRIVNWIGRDPKIWKCGHCKKCG